MTEHKVIWLSPQCPREGPDQCDHPDEIFANVGGRMWCEDCLWSKCPACGAKPARYTLSKPQDAIIAAVTKERERCARIADQEARPSYGTAKATAEHIAARIRNAGVTR